jgi:hypothetical protein
MIRLLRLMLHWFPYRRFVFVGDSAYGPMRSPGSATTTATGSAWSASSTPMRIGSSRRRPTPAQAAHGSRGSGSPSPGRPSPPHGGTRG